MCQRRCIVRRRDQKSAAVAGERAEFFDIGRADKVDTLDRRTSWGAKPGKTWMKRYLYED